MSSKIQVIYAVTFRLAGRTWTNEFDNQAEAQAVYKDLIQTKASGATFYRKELTTKITCEVYIGDMPKGLKENGPAIVERKTA